MNDSNQIQEESIQPPIHTKGELQRPKKRKRITEIGSKSTSMFHVDLVPTDIFDISTIFLDYLPRFGRKI
jgi:hypothetical protein